MNAACPLSPQFAALFERISRQTGLGFPASRVQDLTAGICRIMQQHEIVDVRQLLERLGNPSLFDAIIAELTVGETYFFRDPAQFESIRRLILPSLLQNRPATSPITAWSAGCSTGEEPYSLAILMHEEGLGERARVLATDICRASLRKARRAEYAAWSFRDGSAKLAGRYFEANGRWFRLDERIRMAVTFQMVNLASDPFPRCEDGSELDLILCRNVLMYFEPSAVKRIANRLFDSLKGDGWLLTGPSDPPLWEHAPLETVITPAGVLYRRASEHPRPDAVHRSRGRTRPQSASLGARSQYEFSRVTTKAGAFDHPRQAPRASAKGSVQVADKWVVLIKSLSDAGKPAEAQHAAAEAVEQHPLSPDLHYLQGELFATACQLDEAVAAVRRAIYLDRTLTAAHFLLGRLMEGREPETALRAFRNVVSLCAARASGETVPHTRGDSAMHIAELATKHILRLRRKKNDGGS